MNTKVCTLCKIVKPFSSFSKAKRERDGLQPRCKACNAITSLAHRQNNPEKEKERHARYARKNKGKLSAYSKKWQEKNRDKVRAASRKHYHSHKESEAERMKIFEEKNPDYKKDSAKRWRQENPGRRRSSESKRKAIKLQSIPLWANEEKIEAIYDERKKRTELTGILQHVDHIVPLVSKIVCGLHCEANLRIIPATENLKKRNLYWPDMP